MKLLVNRKFKGDSYTIGDLYINGIWFSNTLEDTDRGLSSDMDLEEIKDKKIYGKTAIPTGTYKITMDVVSEKFKNKSWASLWEGKLPRLIDVPGYEGVLIHVGNTADDTLGCILVGVNNVKGKVLNSVDTFTKLMNTLTTTEEDIEIEIK